MCERVVIINQGKIVEENTLENLTHNISDSKRYMMRIIGTEREIYKALREIPGTLSVDEMGSKEAGSYDFLVTSDPQSDIRQAMFMQMAKANHPILMMKPMERELEDVFLQLTNDTGEVN